MFVKKYTPKSHKLSVVPNFSCNNGSLECNILISLLSKINTLCPLNVDYLLQCYYSKHILLCLKDYLLVLSKHNNKITKKLLKNGNTIKNLKSREKKEEKNVILRFSNFSNFCPLFKTLSYLFGNKEIKSFYFSVKLKSEYLPKIRCQSVHLPY